MECCKNLRQIFLGCADDSNGQAACHSFMDLLHRIRPFACSICHLLGVGQEDFPLVRQLHVAFGSIEQAHAKLRLQIVDLTADGGLGHAKLPRRAGEVECFTDCEKARDLVQMHADTS